MAETKKIYFEVDCKTIKGVKIETPEPTYVLIKDSDDNEILLTSNDFTYTSGGSFIDFEYTHSQAFNGVVQVLGLDAQESVISATYSVAKCKTVCCIGQLLYAAMECTCKCDKCKEDLLRAEKVQLFIEAALFEAEHNSNLTQAENNFNKAEELCVEVCACGC